MKNIQNKKVLRYLRMTGTGSLPLVLAVLGCFPLYGCSAPNENKPTQNVQMINPFIQAESLEKAAEGANFTLSCPSFLKEYSDIKISYIKNRLIQVIYKENASSLHVRKAAAENEDVSGDYNKYPRLETGFIKGSKVTYKGNEKGICTAIWSEGGFSYAITSSSPLTKAYVDELILSIN